MQEKHPLRHQTAELAATAAILHSLVSELTSNDPHPEKGLGKHCSVRCMTLGGKGWRIS